MTHVKNRASLGSSSFPKSHRRYPSLLKQRRSVWSTGTPPPTTVSHPLQSLTANEIQKASKATKSHLGTDNVRFVAVSLLEPAKDAVRSAEVVALNPDTGIASELTIAMDEEASVVKSQDLAPGVQPMFTPEVCMLVAFARWLITCSCSLFSLLL